MSPALTAEQIARQPEERRPAGTATASHRRPVNVEPPSAQERTYRPGNFLRVTRAGQLAADRAARCVTYAPEGGFYSDRTGGTRFTHGVQVGVAQGGSGNLQRDTDALLQGFARSNPSLRSAGNRRGDPRRPHRADDAPDQRVRRDRRAGGHRGLHDLPAGRQRAVPGGRVAARPRTRTTRRRSAASGGGCRLRTSRASPPLVGHSSLLARTPSRAKLMR